MKNVDDVIIDVLNGSATEADLARLEEWIQSDPQNDRVYQEILTYWHYQKPPDREGVERIWRQFLEKEKQLQPDRRKPVRNVFRRFRIPVAAAAVVLIGLAILYVSQSFFGEAVRIQTAFGEKKQVTLPDQSSVILNANSELVYKENQPRKIWLQGEAYFEVMKKPQTGEIFQVITPDLTIEVLGTAFNVHNRKDETRVFLEEGKVKLELKDEPKSEVFLDPGELLTYSARRGREYVKSKSSETPHTSWKEGSLILNMAPLQEVLTQIENIYGMQIQLNNDTLKNHKISFTAPIENRDLMLKILENVLVEIGLKIEQQEGGTFIIQ